MSADKQNGTTDSAASVFVQAGVCGHKATVTAERVDGYNVWVQVESDCPHVQNIAPEPLQVDALGQMDLRTGLPSLLETAYSHCAHAACAVPSALIKAVEVAAGLALPENVSMKISKNNSETTEKER